MSLRLSSSAASSSSRRTSALACSATLLVALPTPCCCSVSGMGMASPVDHLCDEDPGCQRYADNEQRRGAAALCALLLRVAGLRLGRGLWWWRRGLRVVHRGVSFGPGGDQAGPQLAQEHGVRCQLLRQPRAHPVAAL